MSTHFTSLFFRNLKSFNKIKKEENLIIFSQVTVYYLESPNFFPLWDSSGEAFFLFLGILIVLEYLCFLSFFIKYQSIKPKIWWTFTIYVSYKVLESIMCYKSDNYDHIRNM